MMSFTFLLLVGGCIFVMLIVGVGLAVYFWDRDQK